MRNGESSWLVSPRQPVTNLKLDKYISTLAHTSAATYNCLLSRIYQFNRDALAPLHRRRNAFYFGRAIAIVIQWPHELLYFYKQTRYLYHIYYIVLLYSAQGIYAVPNSHVIACEAWSFVHVHGGNCVHNIGGGQQSNCQFIHKNGLRRFSRSGDQNSRKSFQLQGRWQYWSPQRQTYGYGIRLLSIQEPFSSNTDQTDQEEQTVCPGTSIEPEGLQTVSPTTTWGWVSFIRRPGLGNCLDTTISTGSKNSSFPVQLEKITPDH